MPPIWSATELPRRLPHVEPDRVICLRLRIWPTHGSAELRAFLLVSLYIESNAISYCGECQSSYVAAVVGRPIDAVCLSTCLRASRLVFRAPTWLVVEYGSLRLS
jgi:hypothetical protein